MSCSTRKREKGIGPLREVTAAGSEQFAQLLKHVKHMIPLED